MLMTLLLPATKALDIGVPGRHLRFVVGLPAAAVLLYLGRPQRLPHMHELHAEGRLGISLCNVSLCAAFFNLKVVADASLDYSDMASMIRSIIGR